MVTNHEHGCRWGQVCWLAALLTMSASACNKSEPTPAQSTPAASSGKVAGEGLFRLDDFVVVEKPAVGREPAQIVGWAMETGTADRRLQRWHLNTKLPNPVTLRARQAGDLTEAELWERFPASLHGGCIGIYSCDGTAAATRAAALVASCATYPSNSPLGNPSLFNRGGNKQIDPGMLPVLNVAGQTVGKAEIREYEFQRSGVAVHHQVEYWYMKSTYAEPTAAPAKLGGHTPCGHKKNIPCGALPVPNSSECQTGRSAAYR